MKEETIISGRIARTMNIGIEHSKESAEHSKNPGVFSEASSRLETRYDLMRNREFFLVLRQSVIEGMKKMLGEDNAMTLLLTLMPSIERPVEFQRKLRGVFGAASYAFEKAILDELYRKVNLRFMMQKGCQFPDYVEIAARSLVTGKPLSNSELTRSDSREPPRL